MSKTRALAHQRIEEYEHAAHEIFHISAHPELSKLISLIGLRALRNVPFISQESIGRIREWSYFPDLLSEL